MASATLTAAALCLSAVANSHHSEAAFDTEAIVAFEGTVRQFAWRNPHVYIYVETADGEGGTVGWEIETGATPILRRSGWTPASLAPGDRVRVRGHPERSTGRNYAILISIEKGDGTLLSQNPHYANQSYRAASLNGTWKGNQSSIDSFIDEFFQLPLTSKAEVARAGYNFQTDSPTAACIAYPTPASLVASGLYLTEIEVEPDRVVLRSEFFDVERIVYTDGRDHPVGAERTNQGHSIGRWEDGALIVDTTLFADHRSANGFGVPSGAERRVVEHFTLSDDGLRLRVDVTLEDPEYLAEPFNGVVELDYAPGLELYRYDCDPETAQRFKINRL